MYYEICKKPLMWLQPVSLTMPKIRSPYMNSFIITLKDWLKNVQEYQSHPMVKSCFLEQKKRKVCVLISHGYADHCALNMSLDSILDNTGRVPPSPLRSDCINEALF